jgi:hypothetical protein
VAAVVGGRDSLPVEYVEKGIEQIPVVGWLLGPLAKRAAESVAREWERNRSVALRAAARAADMSREDLEDAIATVPGVIPLTVRLLWAAGMNSHDATLKGMGRTLGHAVRDPGLIGEAQLVITAMADFGPNHRAVLEALEAKPTGVEWADDELPEHVDAPSSIVGLCASALLARGLVRIHAGWGGSVPYNITPLGRTVLEVLRELERDDDSS